MSFLKKHFSNIVFAIFLSILLFNPFGLGLIIKSKLISLISFSPSSIPEVERTKLESYEWLLVSNNNEPLDFKTYEGEVVLVNYWATWCPPCVAEMPSIQELYDDYKGKIKFILVTNDSSDKVNSFLNKHSYTFPIYYEQTATLDEFETSSIPITFLIDREGNIVISKKGAADWNSKSTRKLIDELL